MTPFDYVVAGIAAVFLGPELFSIFGVPVSVTLVMIAFGFLAGVLVGATPGLGGVMVMAISLPILISAFGFSSDALLPVMGFLIGVMKGATVGGAVPAILFNTPGTPDSYMTTLDGYPMTQKGQAGRALRVAHFSSAAGDTFSDVVLVLCAPFLALLVERFLDFPEKAALLILSLSFIAALVGASPAKGLLSAALGLLVASIGTGNDFYPRLSLDTDLLSNGFPLVGVVVGVLVIGAVFDEFEKTLSDRTAAVPESRNGLGTEGRLTRRDYLDILPYVGRSALTGTAIGALPGIGSTLAATLGYAVGARRHARVAGPDEPAFGEGAPAGVAATEAANSSVSGANLIPVLSLGIPGNTAAVFLILAADSIGGFNPGPSVFRFSEDVVNPELVIAFGIFTSMFVANALNWTIGGVFMRSMKVMTRFPKQRLLPVVLLLTLTAIYVQTTDFAAIWITLCFGLLGYLMRRLDISPLPFVIAFVLGGRIEETVRQAFAATGSDPWFLFNRPVAAAFMVAALFVIIWSTRRKKRL